MSRFVGVQAVCVRLLRAVSVHHVLRARPQLGLPDRGPLVRPPTATKGLLAFRWFPLLCNSSTDLYCILWLEGISLLFAFPLAIFPARLLHVPFRFRARSFPLNEIAEFCSKAKSPKATKAADENRSLVAAV